MRCCGWVERVTIRRRATLGKPKTIEERVGILEEGKKDCEKLQTERYKNMEKRVGRLEYLLFIVLATGIASLLSIWLKK